MLAAARSCRLSHPHGRAVLSSWRAYSSTPSQAKPSVKLVAELRRLTDAPISKARDALAATNNDLDAALEWLIEDLAISGAQKAAKVEGRTAKEGLVGISVLSPGLSRASGSIRAAMVELNCETDFVARNDLFGRLLADISHSAAFHAEMPKDLETSLDVIRPMNIEELLAAPIMQKDPQVQSRTGSPLSINEAIHDTIAKIGEKISLRRAVSAVLEGAPPQHPRTKKQGGGRLASYTHGSATLPSQGRIGALAFLYLQSPRIASIFESEAFQTELEKLERAIARQIAGFETRSIRADASAETETVLYKQPFAMYPGAFAMEPVEKVLSAWSYANGLADDAGSYGISVGEFVKWTVGEDIESGVVSATREE